ncbi:MAG: FecR domain-containing protein, partial [Bacteroidota bacterium]
RVLGTAFNLKKNSNENIEVSVYEGKISFYEENSPNENQTLVMNERATFYSENGRFDKENKVSPNDIAWKTGILQFQGASISEMLKILMEHYEVVIEQDGNLDACELTTVLDNLTIDQSLNVIALSLDLEVTKSTQGFVITGNCTGEE